MIGLRPTMQFLTALALSAAVSMIGTTADTFSDKRVAPKHSFLTRWHPTVIDDKT